MGLRMKPGVQRRPQNPTKRHRPPLPLWTPPAHAGGGRVRSRAVTLPVLSPGVEWNSLRGIVPAGFWYCESAGNASLVVGGSQSRMEIKGPPPAPRWWASCRRGGTSETATEAVGQAVGGGCQSVSGRLLSITNAIEVGVCRQGYSGWA